jgi:SulP family sulfate permease
VTTTISAAIVAVRSSLPFAIAGPDGATAAVTASLVAALIERLMSEGAPDDLLAPVMIVLAVVTALTGLLLCGLGLARAGAAIRFVPYPVIGGFLGATGWLMISGAVRVITDHPLSFAALEALIEPTRWQSSRPAAPWRSPFTLPCAVRGVPSFYRASCSPELPWPISP